MEKFNWIDIDGIRYSWDGQGSIHCVGRFAYQTRFDGNSLIGLEIENEEGEVAGALHVDFAAATLRFTPAADAQVPHMVVLVGHDVGLQECSLQSLSDGTLQDLLSHADDIDWAALTGTLVPEPVACPPGQALSWDAFHFEEETAPVLHEPAAAMTGDGGSQGSEISLDLDMTSRVLEQLPPQPDI